MKKIKIEILIVVRVVGVIENSKSLVHVIFVCAAYDKCYTRDIILQYGAGHSNTSNSVQNVSNSKKKSKIFFYHFHYKNDIFNFYHVIFQKMHLY
jgi:hypothetical protein